MHEPKGPVFKTGVKCVGVGVPKWGHEPNIADGIRCSILSRYATVLLVLKVALVALVK